MSHFIRTRRGSSRDGLAVELFFLLPPAHAVVSVLVVILTTVVFWDSRVQADQNLQNQKGDTEAEGSDADEEGGVFLPTDRLKQRQLDRVRRLIDESKWSDAATLLDEVLGTDRDFFFRPEQRQSTWQSMKAEASRLIGGLPQSGRDAYELQFRARAERMLQQAVATGDAAGVVAVARRWFHTPSGHRATLLAALESLEHNQPLAAAAWLDRLSMSKESAVYEPTLSIMQAMAWFRAGDPQAAAAILEKARKGRCITARIGGKDLTVSFLPGESLTWLKSLIGGPPLMASRKTSEWWLHRGDPARNALATASRPILVPRYRVPLTRHPEESRHLLKERKRAADAVNGLPLLPAGTPLAVDGSILVHTPMGLLAIDFETGKRTWLQTAGAAAPLNESSGNRSAIDEENVVQPDRDDQASGAGVFHDATSGIMSSDGRLVFVVESEPNALVSLDGSRNLPGMFGNAPVPNGWEGGNSLSAYDVTSTGSLSWRLPTKEVVKEKENGIARPRGWYMGAPLPIGDQLFVLVEEKGEIRLDVLAAATGNLAWSQPLAELDEGQAVNNRDSYLRRIAGLSPSLSEGVLVCPTGAGATIAVDLATRMLLWAYNYPLPKEQGVQLPNGVRVIRGGGAIVINGQLVNGPRVSLGSRWRDSSPILAAGRVLLTPTESDELHCLDLRRGTVLWKIAKKDYLHTAGVVDGKAILVGRRSVVALSLVNGQSVWESPLSRDDRSPSPSGRGILTEGRFFLPLDTPEVVEIDCANGAIAGRSLARGKSVPGNLIAYRGEVISQGVDSLDVFHQASPLEMRIETAMQKDAHDPWALLWRGQLDLDQGKVLSGMNQVREARAAQPRRVSAEVVGEAIAFAMQRDFAAVAPLWREAASSRTVLRLAIDGLIKMGDLPQAWEACQQLIAGPPANADRFSETSGLVDDALDSRLSSTEGRWFQGRLTELISLAQPALKAAIDESAEQSLAAALGLPDPLERVEQIGFFIERFGRHPTALRGRKILVEEIEGAIDSLGAGSDAARNLLLRRDFLAIELLHGASDDQRPGKVELLRGVQGREEAEGGVPSSVDGGTPWPIGRVSAGKVPGGRRDAAGRVVPGQVPGQNTARADEGMRLSRLVSIPVEAGADSFFPGLRLGFDAQQPTLVFSDGFGRRIGDSISLMHNGNHQAFHPLGPMGMEVSAIGRVVVARSGTIVTAFELAGENGQKNRRLWTLKDPSVAGTEVQGMVFGAAAGRVGRNGNIPLGMRISEPDEALHSNLPCGGMPRATGVPILVDRSLRLHDPVTGDVLWERHRLSASGELIGDDEFLCVCPADGKQATVLSMVDGRLIKKCDVPSRRQRLLTFGRRIVAIRSPQQQLGQENPAKIVLELFDPLLLENKVLGEYAADARAISAGVDQLAVVEPSGVLTVIDLRTADIVFQTKLPGMVPFPKVATGAEQLQVTAWKDRYFVFIGRQETPDEQQQLRKFGVISALPQMAATGGREMNQPSTGSIWAVDRTSGEMLWSVPASLLRHCLHRNQPQELPVLLFTRLIQQPGDPRSPLFSVLCLDKRTGHAVYIDDKISVQQQMLFGCDMVGDPAAHTIRISVADVSLEFTGEPMAPRPPFQATTQSSSAPDVVTDIKSFIQRLIPFPQ